MKRTEKTGLLRILAVMLAAVMVLSLGNTLVKAAGNTKADTPKKIEGEGFDTPAEAVTAYAEALKKGDMDALLSTFAVESVVENFDMMKYIARMRAATYKDANLNTFYPSEEASIYEQSSVQRRIRFILQQVDNQLFTIRLAETGYYFDEYAEDYSEEEIPEAVRKAYEGSTYPFSNDKEGVEEAKNYIEAFSETPDLTKMKIGEVFYAEGLSDNYLNIANLGNLYKQAQVYGAEGYRSLAVHVTLGENEALLFMDTVKYNGKWYNYTQMSNLALLIGMAASNGGVALVPTAEKEEWDEFKRVYQDQLDEVKTYLAEDAQDEWKAVHEEYKEEFEGMSVKEIMQYLAKQQEKSFDAYLLPPESMPYEEAAAFFDIDSI